MEKNYLQLPYNSVRLIATTSLVPAHLRTYSEDPTSSIPLHCTDYSMVKSKYYQMAHGGFIYMLQQMQIMQVGKICIRHVMKLTVMEILVWSLVDMSRR